MRWVVAAPGPSFSVMDVYVGWVEALRELGQEVTTFALDERLCFYGSVLVETPEPNVYKRALDPEGAQRLAVNGLFSTLYQTKPDVLLVVSAFFIPPEVYRLARAYGTRIVVLHTESPYENDRQVQVANYADVNLLNDPTGIELYPNATYMPHAYRPHIHCPGPATPKLVCDLAFVGTGYPSRIDWLERADLTGLDVLLAGNWQALAEDSPLRAFVATEGTEECLDNEDTVDVYRSARVGLNLYRREAERPELSHGWALGPREIEMAACGLFFLRDPRGEGDEVLSMLPTFTSPEEAGEQLRFWLAHEDERADVARKAREAIADRTFINHAKQLLLLLDA
jgi:spore maturation protein CgeB